MASDSTPYCVRMSAVLRTYNLWGLIYQSALIWFYWSNVSRISHRVAPMRGEGLAMRQR